MIPVFLIRGFLEAGKSSLINRLLQENQQSMKNILLLSCEEGEIPIDETLCQKLCISYVQLEEESQWKRAYLEQLTDACRPAAIIVECNAMWKPIEFELPRSWQVQKRIAVLCGPTLQLCLNNLRAYMGPMLSRCDQIIINRCDSAHGMTGQTKAALRPLLDDPGTVRLESQAGSDSFDSIADLVPYPLDTDTLSISSGNYVFWFYDCQDHPSRYDGKRFSLEADVKKSPVLKNGEFALGRLAVTCCEADMSFLGYLAQYHDLDKIRQFAHVYAEGTIHYRFMEHYHKVMPYLKITHMTPRRS